MVYQREKKITWSNCLMVTTILPQIFNKIFRFIKPRKNITKSAIKQGAYKFFGLNNIRHFLIWKSSAGLLDNSQEKTQSRKCPRGGKKKSILLEIAFFQFMLNKNSIRGRSYYNFQYRQAILTSYLPLLANLILEYQMGSHTKWEVIW